MMGNLRCIVLLGVSLILFIKVDSWDVFGEEDQPIQAILAKYGLPVGILPSNVKSYSFSEEDGRFEVNLYKPCYIHFSYLVYYEEKITGRLSYGKVRDLDGVQAKSFFIWVNVDGIVVDIPSSDFIYFKVGFISKKLDISDFQTSHPCKDSLGLPCHQQEEESLTAIQ